MSPSQRAPGLGVFCLLVLITGTALADCADVAAPDVYWRRCLLDGRDLRGVDLTGANLRDASFKRADLSEAVMIGTDARRAKFVSTAMRGVRLDGARLVRADLTKADLAGASLKDADLTRARLFRADLSRADLSGARLSGADLLNTVLAGATWIDGKTICSDDSIGQCLPRKPDPSSAESDASG